ncbi:hypothetical protein [Streptomyces albireticuli]|uniref:Uncharacterized protein n=1 Tax=Streptomyces albireticuli TaxID=1940 RepID=A0A2A2DHU0_9ACTN|nr:hypothetical protein [Streptomyces albireticuli]MCD9145132.1 hypothetical protein [Streptomyces albireticuli]MCD9164693.1 hypothetical protein [Streptomyces albireticuli]MCD9194958.1 hypothetical protein [Streptomyces albireticuli]PAU50822.1 hypothetical protein CK936_00515 [Streptomyces albireticuli]
MATAPPHVGALRARLSAAGPWWLSLWGLLLLALFYSHGMMTEGTSAHPVHPALTQMSAAAHSAGGHGGGLSTNLSTNPAPSAARPPATDLTPDATTDATTGFTTGFTTASVSGSAPGSASGPGPAPASGAPDLAAGPLPGHAPAGQGASPAPHNGHDVSHAAQDCLSGAVKDATDLPAALCAAPDRAAPPSYVPGWAVVRLTAHAAGPLPPSAPPTLRI